MPAEYTLSYSGAEMVDTEEMEAVDHVHRYFDPLAYGAKLLKTRSVASSSLLLGQRISLKQGAERPSEMG